LDVLLVDDDPLIVKTFEALLGAQGLNVTTASSAEDGLKLFEADPNRFGIVLTDHDMPGMSGTHFLGALRVLKPKLPIILWTGHGGDANLVARDQITEFLKKPVKVSVLTNTIERLSVFAASQD
jgi:DNA-binding NtrC family response regulator